MEKRAKCAKRQDCYYKLTPGNSGESSIHVPQEIFKFINPEKELVVDVPVEISFMIYKEDYIKALCYITNKLPLYTTTSDKSTEVKYSSEIFKGYYEAINNFFKGNEEAEYHVKLLLKKDNRIYLNDLDDTGFNIRRFIIESSSVLSFEKADQLAIRLYTGEDIYAKTLKEQKEHAIKSICCKDADINKFVLKCIKELSSYDRLESIIPYIKIGKKLIKIEKEKEFSLRGIFIETSLDAVKEINKNDSQKIERWYTDPICLGDSIVYLSTQWTQNDVKNLSLNEFIKMIEICYPMYKYKLEGSINQLIKLSFTPLQEIYFGSPGTGKSYGIKHILELSNIIEAPQYRRRNCDRLFRTTFHPDTDYASFVGCFKPISKSYKAQLTEFGTVKNEASRIKDIIQKNQDDKEKIICDFFDTYAETLLNEEGQGVNWHYIVNDLFPYGEYGISAAWLHSVCKRAVSLRKNEHSQVQYQFIPQVFTEAYIKAWEELRKGEEVFLIIEEINRGNCAQIFGDLFQLLDRKSDGFSEYKVKADKDLSRYLINRLSNNHPAIEGGNLSLPPNLNIIATMNTSDQSLFPMDSAFKRRWSWKYVPINETCRDSQFKINIGNKTYAWATFISKVNGRILKLTESEDKQLGNFFIKKDIDAEEFKSKVMFYLWSEVCKEYYNAGSFFKYKNKIDGLEKETEFTFSQLFNNNDTEILQGFMSYLEVDIEATIE